MQGYLKALGMTRTAQVKRDARSGEAEARRDAGIRVNVRGQGSYIGVIQRSRVRALNPRANHALTFQLDITSSREL